MNRTRTLLALALAALVGLALAQGMMGTPDAPGRPGDGYGNGPYGHHGMMRPGFGRYGPGGMGMMGPGYGGHGGYGRMGGMGMMGPMMGGRGTMGPMMGGGMMRVLPPDAQPLPEDELRARLDAAARAFGPDVRVDDVMPFADHSYAQFVGPDGSGLAEVLVDRYTGVVMPEPGPNMMWNPRTGMAGYRVVPWGGTPGSRPQRYDEAGAREAATTFLAGYLPGAEVLAGQTFPGYATFDYGRDGEVDGMLSVHLASGQVWPHTWHGAFLGSETD